MRSIVVHSFLEVHNCVVPFTSHSKLHDTQFPELNQQIFIFSQSSLLSGVRYSAPVEMVLHLIKSATDFFIRVSFLVQRLTLLILNIV